MSATTTMETSATSAAQASYPKKLEGIQINNDLLKLWKDCYSQVQFGGGSVPSSNSETNESSLITPLSRKQALDIIKNGPHPNQDPEWIPIDTLRAVQVLLGNPDGLEAALKPTSLVFTPRPPPKEETAQQKKFHHRMGRLRLQHEETKYSRLTKNVQREVDDDITGRSMTYAASVGLNMIIAPLSFGCFMYFFAGGVFDYFLDESFSSRTTGGTDIKRVIVGVVSGVAMLFIEMILFVIRTHELESHTRRKLKKKKKVLPFGVYSKKPSPLATTPDAGKEKQALVKKND